MRLSCVTMRLVVPVSAAICRNSGTCQSASRPPSDVSVGGRTSRTSNAYRALQLISGVCDATLAFRADHMDAMAAGLGVTEQAPRGKAAEEVRALLDWTLARLRKAAGTAEAAE